MGEEVGHLVRERLGRHVTSGKLAAPQRQVAGNGGDPELAPHRVADDERRAGLRLLAEPVAELEQSPVAGVVGSGEVGVAAAEPSAAVG